MMTRKMPAVTAPGRARGATIPRKVWCTVAPSRKLASRSSAKTASRMCVVTIRNAVGSEIPTYTSAIPGSLLYRPILLTIRKYGIMNALVGTNSPKVRRG